MLKRMFNKATFLWAMVVVGLQILFSFILFGLVFGVLTMFPIHLDPKNLARIWFCCYTFTMAFILFWWFQRCLVYIYAVKARKSALFSTPNEAITISISSQADPLMKEVLTRLESIEKNQQKENTQAFLTHKEFIFNCLPILLMIMFAILAAAGLQGGGGH